MWKHIATQVRRARDGRVQTKQHNWIRWIKAHQWYTCKQGWCNVCWIQSSSIIVPSCMTLCKLLTHVCLCHQPTSLGTSVCWEVNRHTMRRNWPHVYSSAALTSVPEGQRTSAPQHKPLLPGKTVFSVKLHLRHKSTDERTDPGNRIWCILALKCDIWWQ